MEVEQPAVLKKPAMLKSSKGSAEAAAPSPVSAQKQAVVKRPAGAVVAEEAEPAVDSDEDLDEEVQEDSSTPVKPAVLKRPAAAKMDTTVAPASSPVPAQKTGALKKPAGADVEEAEMEEEVANSDGEQVIEEAADMKKRPAAAMLQADDADVSPSSKRQNVMKKPASASAELPVAAEEDEEVEEEEDEDDDNDEDDEDEEDDDEVDEEDVEDTPVLKKPAGVLKKSVEVKTSNVKVAAPSPESVQKRGVPKKKAEAKVASPPPAAKITPAPTEVAPAPEVVAPAPKGTAKGKVVQKDIAKVAPDVKVKSAKAKVAPKAKAKGK